MTFLKGTIAHYVSILVLAHDGTRTNRAGGAGAWEEIPSMVMSCSRIKDPEGKDIKNKRFFQIQKSRKAVESLFRIIDRGITDQENAAQLKDIRESLNALEGGRVVGA